MAKILHFTKTTDIVKKKNLIVLLVCNEDGRSADVDEILPDGLKVRRGDDVYYMAYAMGGMPHIWGEDALNFRPERWLRDGIFQPESPFKFIAFHVCTIDFLVFFGLLFVHEGTMM